MKKIIIFIVLILSFYQGWQKLAPKPELKPLFDSPYVAVYGRDSCGHTQRLIRNLKSEGFTPQYFSVDDEAVSKELHERMQSQGMSIQRYDLPVVDVNAKLSIRPALIDVKQDYLKVKD